MHKTVDIRTTPISEYLEKVTGINIILRNKLRVVASEDFDGEDRDRTFNTLVQNTRLGHLDPEVKETLNRYIEQGIELS